MYDICFIHVYTTPIYDTCSLNSIFLCALQFFFLFQDGVILPSSASLYIAPFSDDEISER